MICTKCGREIEAGIDFCYFCGEELPGNVVVEDREQPKIEVEIQHNVNQQKKVIVQTKYKEFPSEYERRMRREECEKINQAERVSNAWIQGMEKNISERKPSQSGGLLEMIGAAGSGAVLGGFIGMFACTFACMSGNENSSGDVFVFCLVLGAIIGAIATFIDEGKYKQKCDDTAKNIEKEKQSIAERTINIQTDTNTKIENYKNSFENDAKLMSVQYAESSLASEVIDWMTKGFIKTIDCADRRSHIENIDIPFMFSVYTDKISCNLGTYDFELKRCRNLNSPLEQVALARALASSIQLNIAMKYPRDLSGTDTLINIDYVYGSNYVQVTILYKAINGNFERVRDWA